MMRMMKMMRMMRMKKTTRKKVDAEVVQNLGG